MALVVSLEFNQLERDVPHQEVRCTYSIVHDEAGARYLQLDTYGSTKREILDKKSQSLRLSSAALQQLVRIVAENGLTE